MADCREADLDQQAAAPLATALGLTRVTSASLGYTYSIHGGCDLATLLALQGKKRGRLSACVTAWTAPCGPAAASIICDVPPGCGPTNSTAFRTVQFSVAPQMLK